jgi:FkbM family methyltransferase
MLRPNLLKGTLRHLLSVPQLVVFVHGWPYLLWDCIGLRRRPYILRTRSEVCCEVRPGTSDWWIFLEIFVFGIYRRAQDDIRRAGVIIDVGANVGFFGLYASSINVDAEIHAFEPFPKNAEQLNKNLLLNPKCRAKLHAEAVSDQTRVMELYFTPGDDSGCTLNQAKGQSCSVKVINVNELFDACDVKKCDLLKIDCEGSELSILRAASPKTLMATRAIIMEYHVPAEVETILGILSGAGFKCEAIPSIKTIYASRS